MKSKIAIVLISITLVFAAGCSLPVFHGNVKPIYPNVGVYPTKIDSLTPTFRWQSDVNTMATYDFAIWDKGEAVGHVGGFSMEFRSPIYYKESLSQPEHKIEVPLAPDTIYYWSIRIRSGGKVSPWAKYDHYDWLILTSVEGKNWPYSFKTPKQ
jgi:hypothetical protein